MTDDVYHAILAIQHALLERRLNAQMEERYERALDDLSRHLERTGPPKHLLRNALADAGKALKRRRSKVTFVGIDALGAVPLMLHPLVCGEDETYEAQAIGSYIERGLRSSDRIILMMLVAGRSSQEIARAVGCQLGQVRVRICRARARAMALWERA